MIYSAALAPTLETCCSTDMNVVFYYVRPWNRGQHTLACSACVRGHSLPLLHTLLHAHPLPPGHNIGVISARMHHALGIANLPPRADLSIRGLSAALQSHGSACHRQAWQLVKLCLCSRQSLGRRRVDVALQERFCRGCAAPNASVGMQHALPFVPHDWSLSLERLRACR